MPVRDMLERIVINGNYDAVIHFHLNMNEDVIKELADDGAWLKHEPLSVDHVETEDSDIYIELNY